MKKDRHMEGRGPGDESAAWEADEELATRGWQAPPLPDDLVENAWPPHSEAPPPPSQRPRQEQESGNRPSVSLGPLSLLGFGPKITDDAVGRASPTQPGFLISAAALVVLIYGLKVGRPVLVPFTVSVFFATLAAPVVFYLRKRRVPVEVAVALVLLAGLLLFGGLFGLVAGTMQALLEAAPEYQQRLVKLVIVLSHKLERWGIDASPEGLYSLIEPGTVAGLVGDTLFSVADLLSDTFLVILMTVFVLFEAIVLPDKIRAALRDPNADLSPGLRVVARIKAYVVLKTLISLVTGLAIWILLEIIGVDFALLWGLLAFLLNFIPNIGAFISAVPPTFLALLQLGMAGALSTASICLTVHMIIGNLVEPRVMGKSMNLSSLVVVVSLVFWGWLWGGIGMLLSVPLTMAIRIMLDGNETSRPFAVLMSGSESEGNTSRLPRR
jgi:AI-2 transport protein TqsA